AQLEGTSVREHRERKARAHTVRLEHEFERQLGRRDGTLLSDTDGGTEVIARLLDALVPPHAVGEAHLAVRAGADAEVVAELPVVEVVPAPVPGPGESRGFVVLVTCRSQRFLDRDLHVRASVVLRKLRRPDGEGG